MVSLLSYYPISCSHTIQNNVKFPQREESFPQHKHPVTALFSLFSGRNTQCSLDSSYSVIMMLFFFLGKKNKKVISAKPSLHSPEFYFQGIQCFESQLFLWIDYALNVRTTKLVLFFINQVTENSSNPFTEIHYRGKKF